MMAGDPSRKTFPFLVEADPSFQFLNRFLHLSAPFFSGDQLDLFLWEIDMGFDQLDPQSTGFKLANSL
jgi:hypothetical protein